MPMKLTSRLLVCSLAIAALSVAAPAIAQEKAAPLARQIDADENRQITDIVRVTTATQKVQLLTAFLAAHPGSVARPNLLAHVGISISREQDTAVRVDLAEKFLGLMTTDSERRSASAILADAYLKVNRVDDAFQTIAVLPSPDLLDLRLLARDIGLGEEIEQAFRPPAAVPPGQMAYAVYAGAPQYLASPVPIPYQPVGSTALPSAPVEHPDYTAPPPPEPEEAPQPPAEPEVPDAP